MQNDRRSFFAIVENYIDMIINILAVYIAFFFACLIDDEPPFYPNTPQMVIWILVFVIFVSFVYQAFNIYRPAIFIRASHTVWEIFKANFVASSVLTIFIMLFADEGTRIFTGYWIMLAFVISCAFIIAKRRVIIYVLSLLREKKYNLRKVIIIGDNTSAAKDYVNEVANNSNYGMMILGYVGDKIDPEIGCDKLGSFRELEKVLDKHQPTDVVFAIDSYNKRHLIKLVNLCDDRCIKVYFLPVIYGFFKHPRQIEQVGKLPIINIHTTPLDNKGNAAIKRLMDIVGSLFLIVLTSPFMLAAAIGTKISSPGPIFFKQKRVGRLGKSFTMLKFRSMVVNDTSDVAWSAPGDSRPTRFGSFLRRTAIDELPQLFNVLAGSMSLVGPRPEIPKFVNEFRETVPLYMIKHYVKPGVTGLAQIKGLRGDTSIEERIHEDIAYIEHWSLMLDIYILLKTPFKAFNNNERYVPQAAPELNITADSETFEIAEAMEDGVYVASLNEAVSHIEQADTQAVAGEATELNDKDTVNE